MLNKWVLFLKYGSNILFGLLLSALQKNNKHDYAKIVEVSTHLVELYSLQLSADRDMGNLNDCIAAIVYPLFNQSLSLIITS